MPWARRYGRVASTRVSTPALSRLLTLMLFVLLEGLSALLLCCHGPSPEAGPAASGGEADQAVSSAIPSNAPAEASAW